MCSALAFLPRKATCANKVRKNGVQRSTTATCQTSPTQRTTVAFTGLRSDALCSRAFVKLVHASLQQFIEVRIVTYQPSDLNLFHSG